MIDEQLQDNLMPATVLLNNFVTNENKSSYEFFLLEYLNQSHYFLEKSNYLEYKKPLDESNSEPDALTPLYSIDFKLLASTTILRALRLTSPSITVLSEGITAYGISREPNKVFQGSQIHKIFRSLTLDYMLQLREKQYRKALSIEDDILNVLNTIETKKNLLLFFPYKFYIEKETEIEKLTLIVKDALENDFIELAKYRSHTVPKFETFIITECNNFFLLFTFTPIGFEFVERISINKLPTYMKLLDHSDPFKK